MIIWSANHCYRKKVPCTCSNITFWMTRIPQEGFLYLFEHYFLNDSVVMIFLICTHCYRMQATECLYDFVCEKEWRRKSGKGNRNQENSLQCHTVYFHPTQIDVRFKNLWKMKKDCCVRERYDHKSASARDPAVFFALPIPGQFLLLAFAMPPLVLHHSGATGM